MVLFLLGLLVAVPLLELYVLIQVGQVIGAPATILALLAISLVGAVLVRREGWKAWGRFRRALEDGRPPAREVVDGALLVLGAALLLTPGFVTDAVGFALVLPFTRAGLRRLVRGRVTTLVVGRGGRRARRSDDTFDVEVVKVERHGPTGPPGEVTGGDDGRR